jgi:hypothetical protein
MKIVEDCLRSMVPAHWVTEVEAHRCDVNMLAYPSKESRYTLVVGAWVALLDGGHEIEFETFSNFADLVDSLERDDCTVGLDASNDQLSMDL